MFKNIVTRTKIINKILSNNRSIGSLGKNYIERLNDLKAEIFGSYDIICCFKLKNHQIIPEEINDLKKKKLDYIDLIASTHFYEDSFFDTIGLNERFLFANKEDIIENDDDILRKKKIDFNILKNKQKYCVFLVDNNNVELNIDNMYNILDNANNINRFTGFENIIFLNIDYLHLMFTNLLTSIIKQNNFTPIFIFRNISWMEVLFQFFVFNYRISGGSYTKRHILSPLQYRLFQFLNCVDYNLESHIVKSFHLGNMFSKHSIIDFTKYLNKDLEKINNDELDFYIKRTDQILSRMEYLIELRHRPYSLNIITERINELNFKTKNIPILNNLFKDISIQWRWYDSTAKSSNKNLMNEFLMLKDRLDSINDLREKEKIIKDKDIIKIEDDKFNLIEKKKNGKNKITDKNKEGKISFLKEFKGRSYHTSIKCQDNSNVNNKERDNELFKDNREYSEISSELKDENNKSNESIYRFMYFVGEVIKNSDNNYEKAQEEIENGWLNFVKEKLSKDKSKVRNNFNYIIKKSNETLELQTKIIKRKFPKAYDKFNIDLLIIAFSTIFTHHQNLGFNSIAFIISNNILFYWYKKDVLKKYKKYNDKSSLNDESNLSFLAIDEDVNYISIQEYSKSLGLDKKVDKLKLGSFFIEIFSYPPTNVFERSYKNIDPIQDNENIGLDHKDKNDILVELHDDELYSLAILILNEDYVNNLKKDFIINHVSLPMICKPLKWEEQSYGGFILNSIEKKDLIRGSEIHKHVLDNKNNLYSAVNYLNSIKFKINKSLLNYLENEGKYLWDNYMKDIKNKSGILQSNITIEIAKSYANISAPIYLNVFTDWRSRIYTHSFYISYQGGDLCNSLLQFYDGYPLTDSGKYFLYVFGANCYNYKNISKSSYEDRVKWVEKNYNKIIKLEPDFILKAESKFLFTAFCLTMRDLYNNPKANVYLPVFLDATCSGIQHLAALLHDFETGKKVNLVPQTNNDKVQDLYAELVEPINKAINKYGIINKEYHKFSKIKLSRDLLKTPIMTKVYNVTVIGIANQLKSNTKKKKGKNTFYLFPTENDKEISLTYQEVFILATIINDQIFELLPSLKGIYKYFKDIIRLMLRLNIPIIWFTPSGLKLTQYYSLSKIHKLSITFARKSKTVVLRESLNILDKKKQIHAIIPNIIHSLDASHLINLINKALTLKFEPVISVHDCFGTHPNKLEDLILLVKKEFILLYTKSNFLENFHNKLIQSIKDNHYDIFIDENGIEYINLKRKKIEIPKIPNLGKLNIEEIINSKYFIS